jgi:hypothetical protein
MSPNALDEMELVPMDVKKNCSGEKIWSLLTIYANTNYY